jgi:hypothetical protein
MGEGFRNETALPRGPILDTNTILAYIGARADAHGRADGRIPPHFPPRRLMNKSIRVLGWSGILAATAIILILSASKPAPAEESSSTTADLIKRGSYLVTAGGCDDCHSPKIFVQMGPVVVPMVDSTKRLSGYPANSKLPAVPEGIIAPDKWGGIVTNDLTGWVGPWGVSFARNLTPDVATGLGSWTPEMFIKTMRTGKQMGEGRDLLPPMPWFNYAQLTDDDLRAMFAFLQTLKPIENAVPDPIPPKGMKK